MPSKPINKKDVTTVYSAFLKCDKDKLAGALMRLLEANTPEHERGSICRPATKRQLRSFLSLVEDASPNFEQVSDAVFAPWDGSHVSDNRSSSLDRILGLRIIVPSTISCEELHSYIAGVLFSSIRFAFTHG